MPKKRDKNVAIEEFASQAESTDSKTYKSVKRDKKVLVSFSQEEFDAIEQARSLIDRNRANFIRWSAVEMANTIITEEEN
jgi:uncharacterized protein (DUF1778 family)